MSEATTKQEIGDIPADQASYQEFEIGSGVVIEAYDGALVNEETGEVVGYAGAPFAPVPVPPEQRASLTPSELSDRQAAYQKDVREAVIWATERRARADAKRGGLMFERDALIAGIQERFDGLINGETRRIAWIDRFYGPAMKEFAREMISGAKARSTKLPWATLGFRDKKGAIEVTDAPTAAITLLDCELPAAAKLTIELGVLYEAALKDPEGPADTLFTALVGAFQIKYTEEGEATNKAIVESATLPDGVSTTIVASHVPSTIPDGVKGVSRKAPEDPLGEFYVKH